MSMSKNKKRKHGRGSSKGASALQASGRDVRKALRNTQKDGRLAAAVASGLTGIGNVLMSQRVRARIEELVVSLLDRAGAALGLRDHAEIEKVDDDETLPRDARRPRRTEVAIGAPNGIADAGAR